MKLLPVLAIIISLLVGGCANPAFTESRRDFSPKNWETVAVLPFAGDARFTGTATDTFTGRLLNLRSLRLVQPSQTEVIIKRLGILVMPSGYTVIEAQQIAKEAGADAVISGVVTSHNSGGTLNGFCTAKLIDARSGEIVAVSHHPSGLLIGYSEHQAVVAATERTSKEVSRILGDLEKRNRIEPPANEDSFNTRAPDRRL